MKFSVLIAHYNNSVFFKDCFESLTKQTYQNWEAIILDDFSKPEEFENVKDLIKNDSRFQLYKNDENKGVGFTKAKLIDWASGEICGFVDPDDAILPTAIEKSVVEFQKDPKVSLTYSKFVSCDAQLQPISEFKHARQVPNGDSTFFNFPVQIAHFVCFRKEIYLKTGKMNPQLKIAEDQDLYLKMYEKGKVKFINDSNYLYRTHDKGISQNENKKKSYEYWGEAIFNAMKRRGLKTINGKTIPDKYTHSDEIFQLLQYQNEWKYRLIKKIKLLLQTLK